jgi:inosine-uridine nucleoside N-ribohydrolase
MCLLLGACLSHAQKRLVVVDQDADGPGDSSMESMLMLLNDPTVEVLGITIESGDGWQRECVAHTLRMLELVHRTDVPVYAGATFPLVNSQAASRRWETMYGHWGYKGAWTESWPSDNTVARIAPHGPEVVPPLREGMPSIVAQKQTAADFLVQVVRAHPQQVTVIALGPVTNLALAARLDDGFAAMARELVVMGGGFSPRTEHPDEFSAQVLDSPRMAFNFRWDPEAAAIVLHAGWAHITLVTEDTSYGVEFGQELMHKVALARSPAAEYVARFGSDRFPMWDDIAAGVFLDPSLITQKREVAVDVDLDRGANYGATLSWTSESQPHLGEPTVTAVLAVDAHWMRELFLREISR